MHKDLLEFLSKTLNLDESGVTALFNADGSPKDDSLQKMLDLDKSRVMKLQKGKLDEGYNKAKKEVLTQFETDVKTKFGIDSDKVGVDLVSEIIETKTPKGDAITDEQVKKHRAYLDLQESIPLKIKDAVKDSETKFNNYKTQVERGQSLSAVKQKALTIFESLKPILSTDPNKAANQKEVFLKLFDAGNYRIENERIIMLNADGTDKTDEHANRVDFDKFVKDAATGLYDFQQTDPKGSPGAGGGAAGGGGGKPVVVKDEADFEKQYLEAKTTPDKIAISKAWQETKAASEKK